MNKELATESKEVVSPKIEKGGVYSAAGLAEKLGLGEDKKNQAYGLIKVFQKFGMVDVLGERRVPGQKGRAERLYRFNVDFEKLTKLVTAVTSAAGEPATKPTKKTGRSPADKERTPKAGVKQPHGSAEFNMSEFAATVLDKLKGVDALKAKVEELEEAITKPAVAE